MMPSKNVILEEAPEQAGGNTPDCIDGETGQRFFPATVSAVPWDSAAKKPLSWDLQSLSKAYDQGYLAGIMGMVRDSCPYHSDVVAAAWEGGWEDGIIDRAREDTGRPCDTRFIA